jgi:hypothetical protein
MCQPNAECRMIHDSIIISGCETRHLWSKHITLLLEARDCAWHVIHHIDGMYGGSYRFLNILLTAIERFDIVTPSFPVRYDQAETPASLSLHLKQSSRERERASTGI